METCGTEFRKFTDENIEGAIRGYGVPMDLYVAPQASGRVSYFLHTDAVGMESFQTQSWLTSRMET